MVIQSQNVYVKFNYDRLRIDEALGNFRKSDNNNKEENKNNVCSAWGPFPGSKVTTIHTLHDLVNASIGL